jgi:hypothetical protein
MMKTAFAAIVAAALCTSTNAFAVEVQCADHDLMLDLLEQKYSEDPVAMGTVNEDRFMQLFVSPKGTWTILMTQTDGKACILAAGQNWEALPEVAEIEPAA